MAELIPNDFKINGNLIIKVEQESVILLAVVILIVIILTLLAQRGLKNI